MRIRQGQQGKRPRGRGGRRPQNSRNQVFDSNGPSVRIRGNALQIYEKYQQLARDATSAGERISAEYLMQHAEHYYRIHGANAAANAANGADRRPRPVTPGGDAAGANGADKAAAANAPQDGVADDGPDQSEPAQA